MKDALLWSFQAFDGNELTQCIAQLIDVDRSWVPQTPASSLYIRPTFIGTEGTLGVARTKEALLYVITGPVGPYFPTGLKPVSLLADPQYVRAWHGGVGAYKMGRWALDLLSRIYSFLILIWPKIHIFWKFKSKI